jgi:hypothetical protein
MRIQEIEIGGEKRPLAFSMRALDLFCRESGINSLGELFKKLALAEAEGFSFSIGEVACLLKHAYNEGARRSGSDAKIGDDDAFDMLEEPGLMISVIEGLVGSIQVMTGSEAGGEGEAPSR